MITIKLFLLPCGRSRIPAISPAPAMPTTPLSSSLLTTPATGVPYPQATSHQLAKVLTFAIEELAQHFPPLDFLSWSRALEKEQPTLWVDEDGLFLDDEDLTRLAQRLAASPELPQHGPPLYPDQACYLARRLVKYQDQALHALTEIEAAPHSFGNSVYALVLDLAAGNGIAQQVYQVTHRQTPPSASRPDPASARLAAPARIAAVRRARGERAYAATEPVTAPSLSTAPGATA